MKKKSLLFLLALILALTTVLAGCGNDEEPEEPADEPGEEEPEEPADEDDEEDEEDEDDTAGVPTEPSGELIIGNATELSGDWVPYWQNNAADYDIYNFMSGYGVVAMTPEGEYLINETVVAEDSTEEHDNGDKTYSWTINDNLVYDNGDPITAADYVASAMLWSSNVVGEMGASNDAGFNLVGWKAFSGGEKKEFEGVRLIDEYTFEVTLSAEELPYFYELQDASFGPTNLEFWTDETVEIIDDGDGCYFSDEFTLDAFEDHINSQRHEAFPATGAYSLESYDEGSKTAVLKVNPEYVGDYDGQKPLIETIIYKEVSDETSLDELDTGSVDLLAGLASGDEINAGLDLVDAGGFEYLNYPRSGYGKLTLIGDFGPTQFVEVRQALAHLIDRNDFAKAFTGGYGSVVNGPYGEAMWFYKETESELNEKLDQYAYSFDSAKELLEDGGWTLDADGNDYADEGLRHKDVDGELMPLVLEWASTEDNEVSELLVVKLQENPDVAEVGMEINQTQMTFTELLNYLYRDGSEDPKYGVPTYHMYNLATNYTPTYDLSKAYTTDENMLKQGMNENFLLDDELEQLAIDMITLEPEQQDEFKEIFVDFIVRWNELMPDIPLYSNIYHDFYNDQLQGYEMNSNIRVDQALINAYIED